MNVLTMNESEMQVRRSKIYTYFHGRNTVFQQFLVVLGVLFMLLRPVVAEIRADKNQDKLEKLQAEYYTAKNEYEQCFWEVRYLFDVEPGEYVEVSKGDDYYDEKHEHNDLLKTYKDTEEDYHDFISKGASGGFFDTVLKLGAIALMAVGSLWFTCKFIFFNKDGEEEYDLELKRLMEEAKVKALDKLNIISEQVERIDPVEIYGVAHYDGPIITITRGIIVRIIRGIFGFILTCDMLLLFSICAFLCVGLAKLICVNMFLFVLYFIVIAAAALLIGSKLYKKFEVESYVSPRVFKRLNRFTPESMMKLGSDDILRWSLPSFTVYMFGDDQLYVYYQYIDIVTGKIFCEGVQEYFYEDIVGITSTQETRKMLKRGGFLKLFWVTYDYLRETISVVTSGCTHSESYITAPGNSVLDTNFTGMRNLVRQKKNEK